jgi:hypothetical protein
MSPRGTSRNAPLGEPGSVVVVVLLQAAVQDWKSEAQLAAPDCAVERHPAMQASRPDPGAHPVTQVLSAAATLWAQVPRSCPHAPRQAAFDEPPGDGRHAWTQLVRSLWHVVCAERNVPAQPRMHEPTSLDVEFARQSILQLRFAVRAVLRQATVCVLQPARQGGLAAWAVSANIAPSPVRLHSSFLVKFIGSPSQWVNAPRSNLHTGSLGVSP